MIRSRRSLNRADLSVRDATYADMVVRFALRFDEPDMVHSQGAGTREAAKTGQHCNENKEGKVYNGWCLVGGVDCSWEAGEGASARLMVRTAVKPDRVNTDMWLLEDFIVGPVQRCS